MGKSLQRPDWDIAMLMIKNKEVRLAAGFLETLNWLQVKLLWKNPAKAKSFPGHVFRKYMSLVKQERWNCVAIEELLATRENLAINLVHMEGRGLYTSFLELAYMALITRFAQPAAIFEIGTFWGRTALNFALNSPENCIVYTLDLPDAERQDALRTANQPDANLIKLCHTGLDYHHKPSAHKIKQLYGNSLAFDFSPYHGKVDIVFIDGCHSYESVVSDTKNALKLIRPGGFILWHDFANYGDYHDVTRAVLDLLPASQIYQLDDSQLAAYRMPAGA